MKTKVSINKQEIYSDRRNTLYILDILSLAESKGTLQDTHSVSENDFNC